MGCTIYIFINKGVGSSLLNKPMRMKNIVDVASSLVDKRTTIKVMINISDGDTIAYMLEVDFVFVLFSLSVI